MAEASTNHGHNNMLRYRAWHRGTREMDLLLGPFADAATEGMNGTELAAFEQMLETPDTELHQLITLGGDIAEPQQNLLLKKIRAFHGLAA